MLNSITKWILLFCIFSMPFLNLGSLYAKEKSTPSYEDKVAIIGGGMSGVAAATFLSKSKHQVYLFEAKNDLGGNAQTRLVSNANGKLVDVDIGATYFAEHGWDLYTEFLKYLGLYNEQDVFTFTPGVTISKIGESPHFVTPSFDIYKLGFLLSRISRWCSLYSFYRVNKEAYGLYKNEKGYDAAIDKWLDDLKFNKKDKENILLPFLAAIVDITIARDLSIGALVGLFALSCPLKPTKFKTLRNGMGNMIKDIGNNLQQRSTNVHIQTNAWVQEITRIDGQFLISYVDRGVNKQLLVDKVIATTSSEEVVNLFKQSFPAQDPLLDHLSKLKYIPCRTVLHTSDMFNKGKLSSFLNIEFDDTGKAVTTMKLDEINRAYYKGLYLSYINHDKEYQRLKEGKYILAEGEYRHVFVTPEFVKHRNSVLSLLKEDPQYNNISFAGGWIELTDKQETAISSAYRAVIRLYPEMKEKWCKRLPILKNLKPDPAGF